MNRKLAFLILALVCLAGGLGVLYSQTQWTYVCRHCGYTATYTMPQGVPRCPNDGTAMYLK